MIEVSGVHWATYKAVTEAVLGRRPGVIAVDANPVSQTATVTYDPARTTVAELAGWVRDCGYHCAGPVRPRPCLRPADRTHRPAHGHGRHRHRRTRTTTTQHRSGRTTPTAARRCSPQDADGPRRHHGGMSMDDMVRDMRNRFLVAAVLSVPVLLWSPIGREVLGFDRAGAVRAAR